MCGIRHYYLINQSFQQTGTHLLLGLERTKCIFLFFELDLISHIVSLQFALGHGARRLHVSAAYRATASVAMSRFEPTSSVSYENIRTNVNVVKKRSAFSFTKSFCLREFFLCTVYIYVKTGYVAFGCFPL